MADTGSMIVGNGEVRVIPSAPPLDELIESAAWKVRNAMGSEIASAADAYDRLVRLRHFLANNP